MKNLTGLFNDVNKNTIFFKFLDFTQNGFSWPRHKDPIPIFYGRYSQNSVLNHRITRRDAI